MLVFKNIAIYVVAVVLMMTVFAVVSSFDSPQGMSEVEFEVDYERIAALAFGIFVGAASSQVYDRYLKSKTVNAMQSDFLVGALASTIMTSILFSQVTAINRIDVIFFFAFQNGFLFTTVIEKFKSKGETKA